MLIFIWVHTTTCSTCYTYPCGLCKNDVFYDETRIMVFSLTFFTLLEWPWHWGVVLFH